LKNKLIKGKGDHIDREGGVRGNPAKGRRGISVGTAEGMVKKKVGGRTRKREVRLRNTKSEEDPERAGPEFGRGGLDKRLG